MPGLIPFGLKYELEPTFMTIANEAHAGGIAEHSGATSTERTPFWRSAHSSATGSWCDPRALGICSVRWSIQFCFHIPLKLQSHSTN